MNEITTIHTMTFDGGDVCFDFINSGYDRKKGVITERLHSYQDLLTLVERLALFDEITLKNLKEFALVNEREAEKALNKTLNIRTLLYQLFEGIALKLTQKFEQRILTELNFTFAEALQFKGISVEGDRVQFTFNAALAGLMAPIWKFVLSAYDLIDNCDMQFIRQCERCAWLFIDKTKNHRKKWCSMESCGNRQKTKKYYANKKRHK
ncbi:CGNR zinc finger domain-containing protein [Mucilaginibacter pocheonensis]|uniref:RNA-binding Zn ribbon-like protein n=1 Tax=Mucilaginibacter pocheonensis TaxID=398050 RepID=A0ABU1THJ9_9SPHI|nr:CGNR zinc finger domain-containing protein [Mucilaginibacter pocheonensis]MDR6944789.1 putative RNA-binding Zn ribbon-like protein [Mucilaginibacter pocheonensis]